MKLTLFSLIFMTLWALPSSFAVGQTTQKAKPYRSLVDTNSVLLVDISGKSLTLDDIKRQHAGKVIFLEYWASWCGPCRELMPSSEVIREKVKDLDVAYIYLSIDSDDKKWADASQEEKIEQYTHNYRIVNAKTSDFIKKFDVSFIPQAMVLAKSGAVLKTKLYPGAESLVTYLTKLSQAK